MRRVPCEFLKPGMEVANHVYSIDGRILLAKGVTLTKTYIRSLLTKSISSIYIEDDISRDIYITDVILEETRVEAKKQIKKAIGNFCFRIINKDSIKLKELQPTINDIINQLIENKNMIYDLIDIQSADHYLLSHSVNVCILSLMVGISMNYSVDRLEQLAIGAILHDIGKGLVPQYILNKPGKLTDQEFEEMKKHPAYSLELLRTNPSVSSVSRMVAFQHHERYSGEGYPQGIKGQEILEMAQIVGMADMYDAITANRCYRKAIPPNEAYELLAGAGDVYFKYDLIKQFLSKIAAYPSGTVVELNSDQIAIVIGNFNDYPNTPTVRILIEPDGELANPYKEINLANQLEIIVRRVLSEAEIQDKFKPIKERRRAAK